MRAFGGLPAGLRAVLAVAATSLLMLVTVVDWRVLVVAVLVLAAHAVATLLSHGPAALPVDPRLAALWLRRALLVLVPVPVAWLAVRGLDADLAPSWLWIVVALVVGVLLVLTARLLEPEPEVG